MLFAEVSDLVQIFSLLFSAATTVFLAWIGYLTVKLKEQQTTAATAVADVAVKAAEAAVKVGEVKETLITATAETTSKLDQTLNVINVVHTLVNHEMHLALAATARLARKVANDSGKDEDIEEAQRAEDALTKHDAKQRIVDQGKG